MSRSVSSVVVVALAVPIGARRPLIGMADLGWFVTDRIAVLAGGTFMVRPGDEDLRQTLWRLGIEYRAEPKHCFQFVAGAEYNHGDDTQSSYVAFLVTALELAFR